MSNAVYLPYDLIACVMETCRDDYPLLYQCSLVNWHFNQIVTRILYSRVILSPPFRPVLHLSDIDSIPVSNLRGSTFNLPNALSESTFLGLCYARNALTLLRLPYPAMRRM